jgi:thiol-disulfide isomerase/thioredoxin
MDLGRWVLLVAVVGALGFGGWRAISDGRARGTHRVRGSRAEVSTGSTDAPERVSTGSTDERPGSTGVGPDPSVLVGTASDGQRGERATLLQFSSAFCAPCRATRRILGDVATSVPGVAHVEVDAEEHLDLVRRLGVLRTPTTLVLDAEGREITRATGAPKTAQVLAALDGAVS